MLKQIVERVSIPRNHGSVWLVSKFISNTAIVLQNRVSSIIVLFVETEYSRHRLIRRPQNTQILSELSNMMD